MALAAGHSSAATIAVLKRFDKDVEDVLASSGHVSLYSMSVSAQQWVRKDVEGSLFLIKRRSAPRYQMLVLNKQSTQNYVEDIHVGMDFEVNPPYLMYTHGNSEIIGVWFYEQQDLHTVERVLTQIKETCSIEPSPNLLDFLKQQAELVVQPDSTATTSKAALAPAPEASANEDDFWDKPNKAKPRQQAPTPAPAPAPAAAAAQATALSVDGGASNLANLLRNAGLKPQQQQLPEPAQPAAAGSGLPQLLPPSFFSRHRHTINPDQPVLRPAIAAAPAPQAPQAAAASPQPPQRPAAPEQAPAPAQAPAPVLLQQQLSSGAPMGGPLAKLFANAHKPPAARPAAEPAAAAPAPAAAAAAATSGPAASAAAPHSVVPQTAAAVPPADALHAQQQAQQQPAAAAAGASDEERVRRLLARIATNEGLVKMLAAEMRAVGLL